MDIDAVALKVKNIEDLKNVQKLLPVTGPNSLIHIKMEWHDLNLKTDISMKEIAKQNNKDYDFCFNCSCKKCQVKKKKFKNISSVIGHKTKACTKKKKPIDDLQEDGNDDDNDFKS